MIQQVPQGKKISVKKHKKVVNVDMQAAQQKYLMERSTIRDKEKWGSTL